MRNPTKGELVVILSGCVVAGLASMLVSQPYFTSVPPPRSTPEVITIEAPTEEPQEVEEKPKNLVVCYSAPGCTACERWKWRFKRGINKARVEIVEKDRPEWVKVVPSFEVFDSNGNKKRHQGYLTASQHRRLVR